MMEYMATERNQYSIEYLYNDKSGDFLYICCCLQISRKDKKQQLVDPKHFVCVVKAQYVVFLSPILLQKSLLHRVTCSFIVVNMDTVDFVVYFNSVPRINLRRKNPNNAQFLLFK